MSSNNVIDPGTPVQSGNENLSGAYSPSVKTGDDDTPSGVNEEEIYIKQ